MTLSDDQQSAVSQASLEQAPTQTDSNSSGSSITPSKIEDFTSEAIKDDDKTPKAIPYDPSQDREKIRGGIAITLVATLVVVLLTILTAIFFIGEDTLKYKDIFNQIITPLIAVVGTVVGFYFGQQSAK